MEDWVELPSWEQVHLVGHRQYHSTDHKASNLPRLKFCQQVWVVAPQACCIEAHLIADFILLSPS